MTSDGFAVVYSEHRDPLLRFAVLLCGDRDVAEDVVADSFARVWPRWERGEVHDVGAYLRRSVSNRLATFWRRRQLQRDRELHRHTGDHRGQLAADQVVADRDAVLAAVRRLPDKQRDAVVLRFYEDRTTVDIAAVLGVREATVRSHLARAAASLRQALDAGGTP